MTCKCFNCGQIFYTEESQAVNEYLDHADDVMIDNEDELQAAEDEIRKNTEDNGDRRFR